MPIRALPRGTRSGCRPLHSHVSRTAITPDPEWTASARPDAQPARRFMGAPRFLHGGDAPPWVPPNFPFVACHFGGNSPQAPHARRADRRSGFLGVALRGAGRRVPSHRCHLATRTQRSRGYMHKAVPRLPCKSSRLEHVFRCIGVALVPNCTGYRCLCFPLHSQSWR